MAKRLSEAQWAKARYDREHTGLSFRELVLKYNVGIGTIHRRAKEDNWSEPGIGQSSKPETKRRSKKKDDVTPECLQDEPKEEKPIKDKHRPVKRNTNGTSGTEQNGTEQNGTLNGTPENSKDFDLNGYVSSLKSNFDPLRARDREFISYQLEQIDHHLGGLVDVIGVDDGNDILGNASKYNPAFARVAYNIALLGGTPKSLAEILNISEQTVYNWLKTHNDFHIAWYGGKDFADANVVKALYRRAVGWKEDVEESRTDKEGNIATTEKTLIFAPDVQAQMFWLKNRQPQNWKDKVEVREEVTVAIVDHEEANARYNSILDKASSLKASLHSRGSRLGLTLDGESEEVE